VTPVRHMSTNTLATTISREAESAPISKVSWFYIRSLGATQLRKHPWLLATASLLSCITVAVTFVANLILPYKFAAAALLALTSFTWGYWKQAVRRRLFPPLAHLRRRQYAATWDQLAANYKDACVAAAGPAKNEEEFRASAASTIRNLLELAQVRATDKVLEVGCGVGRIGEALAPHCSKWTGADTSVKMLSHASNRLRELDNVQLVRLRRAGLSEFDNCSFDVVYFTNMLMHLDEMDQWGYANDAYRVLRPGGRIFMDIIDIESELGWDMFTRDAARYKHAERPPYSPRFSAASELQLYLQRAGFERVQTHRRSPIAIVTGIKSQDE